MKLHNRILGALALGVAATSLGTAALAATCPEGYPSKPVTFVVGFGAGGGTDAIGRAIASAVEQQQGWTVVVENQPGAGGGVMSAALKNAEPDGYTVGMAGTDTVTLNPYTTADSPYTWEDFDYPASAMQIGFGLVAPVDKPYDTLEELVEYARENGRATISVAGVSQELAVKQIAAHYDVELTPVPGQGAADALQSALGGHVDATTQGSQHVQQIQAGAMKQLATLTDRKAAYAPEAKTLAESGLDDSVAILAHTMFMLPKGVDPAIQQCLSEVLDEAVQSESYGELMANFNNEALNLGPEGITEMIAKSAANYEKLLAEM